MPNCNMTRDSSQPRRDGPIHDEFDRAVTDWVRTHTAAEVAEMLSARGVPAERLLTPDRMYDVPSSTPGSSTRRWCTHSPEANAIRDGRFG